MIFFRFLLYREVLKIWLNQTLGWEFKWHYWRGYQCCKSSLFIKMNIDAGFKKIICFVIDKKNTCNNKKINGSKKNIGWVSTFETTKYRTTDISNMYLNNERWVIRFIIFEFIFLFFYSFKLFEDSKYMIIYRIGNFLNLIVFQIVKFWSLLIFEMEQFYKFDYFMDLSIMEIWRLSKFWHLGNFWNFPNWKFFVFYKLDIFGIS